MLCLADNWHPAVNFGLATPSTTEAALHGVPQQEWWAKRLACAIAYNAAN